MQTNRVREKVLAGEPTIGCFLGLGSPNVAGSKMVSALVFGDDGKHLFKGLDLCIGRGRLAVAVLGSMVVRWKVGRHSALVPGWA